MVGQHFKQQAFIQQFLGIQRHIAELSLQVECDHYELTCFIFFSGWFPSPTVWRSPRRFALTPRAIPGGWRSPSSSSGATTLRTSTTSEHQTSSLTRSQGKQIFASPGFLSSCGFDTHHLFHYANVASIQQKLTRVLTPTFIMFLMVFHMVLLDLLPFWNPFLLRDPVLMVALKTTSIEASNWLLTILTNENCGFQNY